MSKKELTLEITNHCEKKCEWCSSSSHWQGEHVTLSNVKGYLSQYTPECSVVRLSGGEPLSHPNIEDIVHFSKGLYERTIILTSGDRKFAKIVEGVSYIVNMVDHDSYDFVTTLRFLNKPVSMHVVMAYGNEHNLAKAVRLAVEEKIPLRLLRVQLQGRASGLGMLLVSWTHDRGCNKNNKITVTHDGKVVTCSALKYKSTCDLLEANK